MRFALNNFRLLVLLSGAASWSRHPRPWILLPVQAAAPAGNRLLVRTEQPADVSDAKEPPDFTPSPATLQDIDEYKYGPSQNANYGAPMVWSQSDYAAPNLTPRTEVGNATALAEDSDEDLVAVEVDDDEYERDLLRSSCSNKNHPLFKCSKCPGAPQGKWCEIGEFDKALVKNFKLAGGDVWMCDTDQELERGVRAKQFQTYSEDGTECSDELQWGIQEGSSCRVNCKGFKWRDFSYMHAPVPKIRCVPKKKTRGKGGEGADTMVAEFELKFGANVCETSPYVYLATVLAIFFLGILCVLCATFRKWRMSTSRGDDWDA